MKDMNLGNLVPGSLSYPSRDPEWSGQVSPRIWEITNKRFEGGADKCEIFLKYYAPEALAKTASGVGFAVY